MDDDPLGVSSESEEEFNGNDSFAVYDLNYAPSSSFEGLRNSSFQASYSLSGELSSYFDWGTSLEEEETTAADLSETTLNTFVYQLSTVEQPQSPHVHFGSVTVREYEVVYDTMATKDYCCLTLGWNHGPDKTVPLAPLWRNNCSTRRLTFAQRRTRLAVVQGWTRSYKSLRIDEESDRSESSSGRIEETEPPSMEMVIDHAKVA